jgi:hypothetical protein
MSLGRMGSCCEIPFARVKDHESPVGDLRARTSCVARSQACFPPCRHRRTSGPLRARSTDFEGSLSLELRSDVPLKRATSQRPEPPSATRKAAVGTVTVQ